MFNLLVIIAFVWLLVKVIGVMIKVAWGLAKVVASILMIFALPLLIVCFIFWGGITLALPIILLCIAFGILRACV